MLTLHLAKLWEGYRALYTRLTYYLTPGTLMVDWYRKMRAHMFKGRL